LAPRFWDCLLRCGAEQFGLNDWLDGARIAIYGGAVPLSKKLLGLPRFAG
jgi:hypothetical protein